MKAKLAALRKRRSPFADESGFTMTEMVVAIPIVTLLLGLVFTSVAVTTGLMGEVTKGAGAARVANIAVDSLIAARNCADMKTVVNSLSNSAYSDKFLLTFPYYNAASCSEGNTFNLNIDVKDKAEGKSYYSKTITLAAM